MRALGVLLAIVALALGVYWWTGVRGPELAEATRAAPPEKTSAAEPQPKAELETPPAAVPPPATEPLAPSEDSEHVPVEIPPVDFEPKYKGWSLEQLAGVEAALSAAVTETLEGIFAERLQAGLYEEEFSAPGETWTSKPFAGPSRTWSEIASDGRTRHRSLQIPVDDYPRLKAMLQEQSWLRSQLATLRKPKQG